MKHYEINFDINASVTVEAKNEDEAWALFKDCDMKDFLLGEHHGHEINEV